MITAMQDNEIWDQLLAKAADAVQKSVPVNRCPLRLREPFQRHLQQNHRTLAEIDVTLRSVLKALILGEQPWPLFLVGPPGTGKTAAALALLDHAGGEYYTAESLSRDFIAAQNGRLERGSRGNEYDATPEDLWSVLKRAPLVVLDELGTRSKVSDFAYNLAKDLIDLREGRPFIAIANDEAALTNSYDARIRSRLMSGTVFALQGRDRRFDNHQARS